MSTPRVLILALVVAVLLVSAFGAPHSGLMHDGDAGTIGCPLMGHEMALCPMDALWHISAWQNLFAAIPAQSLILSLLLLIAALNFSLFREFLGVFLPPPPLLRISRDPEHVVPDALQRFIARGLMHPKIF